MRLDFTGNEKLSYIRTVEITVHLPKLGIARKKFLSRRYDYLHLDRTFCRNKAVHQDRRKKLVIVQHFIH